MRPTALGGVPGGLSPPDLCCLSLHHFAVGATAQRLGEPAWHRRRRRQRADARTVLRLAAAGRLLARHHSAQPAAAMPGGGRAQSDARIAALEQQIRELRRLSGGDGGGPRGGAARGEHAGGGGARRGGGEGNSRGPGTAGGGRGVLRPGDWVCPACGASPCWARTAACFRCGEARPGGRGARPQQRATTNASLSPARRDIYLGPRGAEGNRPLLGGRGGDLAGGGGGRPSLQAGPAERASAGAVVALGGHEPRARDGEGFQLVNRSTWPKVGRRQEAAPTGGSRVPPPTSWAEAAKRAVTSRPIAAELGGAHEPGGDRGGGVDSDQMLDDAMRDDADGDPCERDSATDELGADVEEGVPGDDDDGGDDEEGQGPSEEELRRAWEDAKESVKLLERNPRTSSALVDAARNQRDQAEADWRAAKRPQPLHKRLRWAQKAYDTAVTKQQLHQDELDRFEAETAERRRVLVDRLQLDKARTAKRLRALEGLLDQGEQRQPLAAMQAAKAAAKGIAMDLGPALAAVADKVSEDSPVWMELQSALATLANVEDVLRHAVDEDQRAGSQPSPPAQFDISDEATHTDHTSGRNGAGGAARVGSIAPTAVPSAAATSADGAGATASMSAAAPALPPKWLGPQSGSTRWGGGQWRKQETDAARRAEGPARGTTSPNGAATDAPPAQGSSVRAKELAVAQIAEHQRTLDAAWAQQQLQAEHQLRAEADAKAAAETVRRAQQAVAEAEAAEAARQEQERLQLIARSSPEDLRRAQEVHAQQAALIQQQLQQQHALQQHQVQGAEAQLDPQGDGARGLDADAEKLMAMSVEDFHQWNDEAQRGNW